MGPIAFAGCAGSLLLAACTLNEIDVPVSPCRRTLRSNPGRTPVDFVRADSGQLTVFRKFRLEGDSLRLGKDTLLAGIGSHYAGGFDFTEQVCPEDYLSPYAPAPTSHFLQRVGEDLRPMGFSELLPYDGSVTLFLRPEGPLLPFLGLRPPEGLVPPLQGRIAGFTAGGRILDTLAVRVEEEESGLRFWIYSAEEGPVAAARMEPGGDITGWIRED